MGGLRGPDVDGFVRHFDVESLAVGIGINSDRFDAHLARGLDDAAGNFTAVGNQDLLEHRARSSFGLGNRLAVCRRLLADVSGPF